MFADPVKILKQFGLGDSMIVADLGTGSGFYALAAARMVPNGKVYAIDVQRDFLTTVKTKAETEQLKNIELIWGDIEKSKGTKLKEYIVDVVIISNVLFLADHKIKILEEAHRILKPGGRVLFIDWADATELFGPKPSFLLPPAKARELFKEGRFTYDRDVSAGEHHYGMIFKKA